MGMTIEEAIEIFKEVRAEVLAKETELSKQVFENLGIKAVDLAIKVLEQQPCDDCISRADILDAIETWDKFGINAEQKLIRCQEQQAYDMAIKALEREVSQEEDNVYREKIWGDKKMTNQEAIKELEYVKKQTGYADIALDMAIKALETQPCEDCISREAVMSALFDLWEPTEYNDEDEFLECLENSIKRLPSVIPQQTRWFPVSERLPKYGKEVLTCSNDGFIEIQSIENDVWDEYNYWENQNGDRSDFDEVIAWQPLPESYKAESEANTDE